ncbi:cyclic nucleotide-binding domain protein [Trichinella nativa]|uniref:Cyclic nucleotide-binding domain protein n=1 Tax=Trichinella nativa TaxID=6335 RepID=A0A1Y3ELS3_9BILA|nr:cyclic nucleotide-binding domain protein [Trichinella nativa]
MDAFMQFIQLLYEVITLIFSVLECQSKTKFKDSAVDLHSFKLCKYFHLSQFLNSRCIEGANNYPTINHFKNLKIITIGMGCIFITWVINRFMRLNVATSSATKYPVTFSRKSSFNYRFRKRDRMLFYGRKLMRKVTSAVINGDKKQKLRKRDRVFRFASKFLRPQKKDSTARPIRRPPDAFLEADTSLPVSPKSVQLLNMLKSIRILGHFEIPFFLDVCKHIETKRFAADQFVFKDGEIHDCIYIVESGRLSLFIKDEKFDFEVKSVGRGDSLYCSLNILDMIKNQARPMKNVFAKATEESVVLQLKSSVFNDIFDKYPESWTRTVQIILLRFQRITLATLYRYFGFTSELSKTSIRAVSKLSPLQEQSCKDFREIKSENEGATPEDCTASENTFPTFGVSTTDDDSDIFQVAIEELAKLFGMKEASFLVDKVKVEKFEPGIMIVRQGSNELQLFYVVSGMLELLLESQEDPDVLLPISIVQTGDVIGGLSVLSGEPSFFAVRTRSFCQLAIVERKSLYECVTFLDRIISEYPRVVVNVASTAVESYSDFVKEFDMAVEWEICESGKALYKQNEQADALYVVLSGRLRSVLTREPGTREVLNEHGRGDVVGLVEIWTLRRRSTSVIAIRDTELCKIYATLMNFIKNKHPQVLSNIIRLLGHCIIEQQQQTVSAVHREPLAHVSNLNTIAVLAVSDEVPLTGFTVELWNALNSITPTELFSSYTLQDMLGPTALDKVNEYQIITWLNQQEDGNSIVLYQCDVELTTFTSLCIRRADCILIVANGEQEPMVGEIEKELENLTVRAQKELILLWHDSTDRPRRTAEWLDLHGWVSSHYHVRFRDRVFKQRNPRRMLRYKERIIRRCDNRHTDIARLARALTSTSIGIVFGGGGARGAAHVGIIKALKDHGIPVDIVAGVSIGAFVGGMYCLDSDVPKLIMCAKQAFKEAASFWARLFDLTYPVSALFTGKALNRLLKSVFNDVEIEDLWIPYFNVTTDITSSEMRVHRSGKLWRFTRASMSYIGILPPLCDPLDGHYLVDGCYMNNLPGTLWRYCRASMSLAGFVPPIFDLTDEHLLLDGGYLHALDHGWSDVQYASGLFFYIALCSLFGVIKDASFCFALSFGACLLTFAFVELVFFNMYFAADVMRSLGVRTVIAVDVGALTETEFTNYGDYLSGWWALWKKYNPWASPVRVMSMAEIQSRLAYVSCVRQLEEVKKAPYCHYVRPPIDKYQTSSSELCSPIQNVGYWHGKTLLEEWKSSGKLHELFDGRSANLSKFAQREKFKRVSFMLYDHWSLYILYFHSVSEEEGDDRIPLDLIHTTSSSSVKLA